jgi:hypothetical protein
MLHASRSYSCTHTAIVWIPRENIIWYSTVELIFSEAVPEYLFASKECRRERGREEGDIMLNICVPILK